MVTILTNEVSLMTYFNASVQILNECGFSSYSANGYLYPVRGPHIKTLSLFPNPASSTVSINLNEDTDEKDETETGTVGKSARSLRNTFEQQSYKIQLWNSFGLVKTVTTDQKNYQLDVSGLPAGFYYVHVIKDGKTHREHLIIK